MKTRTLFGAALLLGIFTSAADNPRYVTVTATFGGPATVQIQQGETAELVSSVSTPKNGGGETTFLKSGGGGDQLGFGVPLTGPATITATAGRWNTVVITVKITSESVDVNKTDTVEVSKTDFVDANKTDSFDVNKTLILPPGTNQIYITLESSTNLVNWVAATNGVYGSPDTVIFFRIRTKALASP
jgi:hypothetical protein